jgi:hypothetical protein
MIGDTTHDLQMALNAGCASVGVSYGAHEPEAFHALGPRLVVALGAELHQLAAGARLRRLPWTKRLIPLVPAPQTCVDGGDAVPFDVVYGGQTCRAFAMRFEGQVHAYLNRCTHVAMEWTTSPTVFSTTPAAGCCAPPMARRTGPIPAPVAAGPAAAGW